jgi:hypothetical protein
MQALVDCEISFGQTMQDWRINRSSLPYKTAMALDIRRQANTLVLADLNASGQRFERVWEIVELEGDSSIIFDTIPQNF